MNRIDNIGISVIIDNHPRFFCEFVLWALCTQDSLDIPKRVYFIDNKPDHLIKFAERLNIDIKFSKPLIQNSPHCNKIIPFLDKDKFDNQIVSDTDLFFSRNIVEFFKPDLVRLPPNNHASPPLKIFEDIAKLANIDKKLELGTALFAGNSTRETFSTNVSAGLIFIPSSLTHTAKHWHQRAQWLTDNNDTLGSYKNHVDQVSFALTVHQHDIPFSHLPAQSNAILQLLPQINSVYGFHLTSGHIPKFKHYFNSDSTLNANRFNPLLESDCHFLNERILQAKSLLKQFPESRDFADNFLNPKWIRD